MRDDLGRIVEKTETTPEGTRVLVYEYDLAARLAAVYEDGLLVESYGFDDNGNRLSSLNADGVFDAAFDDQDRLLEYGDESFTWTDNGELLAKVDTATGDTTTFAYDAVGNLRGVGLPSGDLVEYLVDGRGRRVGKKINGALVKGWLWRGQLQPVAELDGAGNVVARFVYAGGVNVPALMVTPTATYRLVTDHLGSVRRVVDVATGAVAQEVDYDAWGQVLLDTNPGVQPFGFAGGLYDPDTGLVRFGARDYDAETGRWTAKDPILFGGGVNLLGYVAADPVNREDPRGLEWGDSSGGSGAPAAFADPEPTMSVEVFCDEPSSCTEVSLNTITMPAPLWGPLAEVGFSVGTRLIGLCVPFLFLEGDTASASSTPYREPGAPDPCQQAGIDCQVECNLPGYTIGQRVVCHQECMRKKGC
ncbi:MAG: RHS repeat-associated core domain-containing protein [Polyangiaceae bacterium]|nr:RHS repeat-associated core domain-containing protein [Polyangiaceae bacterium]